ncbi:hypothetical protein A3F07_00980 [candidate division WWE3 bacterium RIFCSPHIGHO2_12_FULL_38_15]|uniref:Uncharacterized protein n=1 Tax=candidate division WWE3 bacterium RIFCSPHIGHO2_02_FULL_38_14 TaxID=1802620 RepID=A0A1F4VA60_UNCKA|nr:MAG: hypothetical protein A2793_03820 [candidate division WWE3 bacterium RIFCSPHIGHO2_01_FULL_38_45]OGC49148.1 MAG: hypothetical protein A3F07_00980 [candidate division WWE3 bacterium RIFCSPHIGHO2_12_FULL_38_15]OGC52586.1 MAG: hypothetical protein A3B64_03425 [candidate division WWE3 bacterium RIFCSPLOWO2_01_FULL_37_24]OGC54077.1 MAG: hypothetical protein A3D91_04950 [candidate division WWE3 bacterium RIFCSPHIGHO2_02_FULL_38_14]HLB51751.1 glycosyltransferase family 39 protein [Patescibacteri
MPLELLVLILLFLLCIVIVFVNFDLSIYLLLILSVLLHKELFSIYQWDLLPIRFLMVSYVILAFYKLIVYLIKVSREGRLKAIIGEMKQPLIFSLLLLWIIRGLSIVFTKNIRASLLLYLFFTAVTVFGVLFIKYLIGNKEKILMIIKAYIWIVFVLSLFGFLQFYLYTQYKIIIGALWNVPDNLPRIGSLFWDVNHFGALLAALLPVVGVFFLISDTIKKKLLYLMISIPILVILLLTNSRSAWILAFVSFITFVSILFIRKFGIKGVITVFAAIIIISIPLTIEYSNRSSPFRAGVKQYFHYRMDSFDSHLLLLQGTFQIFEKYPILGGGYGSFFEHFSKTKIAPVYFGRDPAALNTRVPAHTIWGEALSETGYAGLSALVIFLGFGLLPLLYVSIKSKERDNFLISGAMFSALLGWLVAGIFYSYNSEFFWILTILYFAFGYTVLPKDKSIKEVVALFITSNKFIILFLCLLSAFLIFVSLGKNHLIPWDEAIYAKISKNMVVSGDYIVQRWVPHEVWYEKPPLYMWMTAAFMKVLGFSSLAARITSALFGFASVLLVFKFGKYMYGKTAGLISAFVLLTTTQFLYYSRSSMLDVTTTFFITAAIFSYWISKYNKRMFWPILSGVFIGLAVMTKGVIGLLPFGIMVFYEFYLFIISDRDVSFKSLQNLLITFVSSAVIFLPWHIKMYGLFGDVFINKYIVYHVLDRATSAIEDKGRPFWWYIIVIKVSMRVWFLALLGALPVTLYTLAKSFTEKSKSAANKKEIFLLIWMAFIFMFFSVSTSKLVWYIIPFYPAASLFVGSFLSKIIAWASSKVKFMDLFSFRLISIYLLVSFGLIYLLYNKNLVYTGDLIGSQARLIQLKDEKFGTDEILYLDKIEQPLALFYTEGAFELLEYSNLKNKILWHDGISSFIFITKESRFNSLSEQYPNIKLEMKDGDWSLGYIQVKK